MMKTPPTSRHDIRNTTTMPRISRDSFRPASTGMSDFGSVAGQRFYPKSEIRHPKSTRRSPEPLPRYNLSMATEVRRSVCALDCPDACAMLVTAKAGVATRLRGDRDHPITRGFLCGKVARYLDREYSPDRLLYPQRRVGAKGEGRFARIGWDEALDEIASRLAAVASEFGPEAGLPYSYARTMGFLNGSGMDRRFFHRLVASRLDRA